MIESQMADNGVIFSDGMVADFLAFNAGVKATIAVAAHSGHLTVYRARGLYGDVRHNDPARR